ncbi:MAG: HAD-IIA family hydrolase [Candidatus Helarchaeota archaeon]
MTDLLDYFDLFILDLDGVIYEGNSLLEGASEFLETLNNNEKQVYVLTNNSTLTREMYYQKLVQLGINIPITNIFTSAYSTALYITQNYGKQKTVFVIGEIGLMEELNEMGIKPVNREQNSNLPNTVDFVVAGLDRYFNYDKMAIALRYFLNGAIFIASNNDPTLPTDKGILPGAGSIIAALSTCFGKGPVIIVGKPNPFSVKLILDKADVPPKRAVIIGDRYTTDISAGLNAKINTIMVLTGAGKSEKNIALNADLKPHLIVDSVSINLNYCNT